MPHNNQLEELIIRQQQLANKRQQVEDWANAQLRADLEALAPNPRFAAPVVGVDVPVPNRAYEELQEMVAEYVKKRKSTPKKEAPKKVKVTETIRELTSSKTQSLRSAGYMEEHERCVVVPRDWVYNEPVNEGEGVFNLEELADIFAMRELALIYPDFSIDRYPEQYEKLLQEHINLIKQNGK